MSCKLTNNIVQCDFTVGGFKNLYVVNFDDLNYFSYDIDNQIITGITLNLGANIFQLESNNFFVTANETLNKNNNKWSNELTVEVQLFELEYFKRLRLMEMLNSDVILLAKTNNGNVWVLGEENGLTLSTINGDSGLNYADYNGYKLIFKGLEKDLSKFGDGNLISDIELIMQPIDCYAYSGITWSSATYWQTVKDCLFSQFT